MTKLRTIQILRGTTTQNDAYTGLAGELTMDTTTNEVRIHDGTTQGGAIISSNRANKDLSNLTSTGANIANWSSNVTNCITEIPQDINLTLSSGTLTLKAGSKGYKGDGTVITNPNVLTKTLTTDGQWFVAYENSGYLTVMNVATSISSNTQPANPSNQMGWFDTTNNRVMKYSGGWTEVSLPIAIVTVSGGAISSIDQVFNGFGYIGSTVFALPGVKGLTPNDRNADGTLKNTAWTITNVIVRTFTTAYSGDYDAFLNGSVFGALKNTYSYDEANNRNKDGSSDYNSAYIGTIHITSGVINQFNTKTAFHAVDYNDAAIKNADNVFTGKNTFADLYVGESRFANNGHLELVPSSGTTNGGYLDFHYAGSSADYTSRIIESESGRLSLIAPNGTIANASDANSSVVTTVAKSKSANGYFKLGNGLIVQWGEIPAEQASTTGTVTLPTAFTTTNYTVGIFYNNSVQNGKLVNPFNETTTAFSYATNSWYSTNPSIIKRWIAIGY